MSRRLGIACGAIAALVTMAGPAAAFGDICRRDVRATGGVQSSMASARAAAISAWEKRVRQSHGARFANWYYSGDRVIECGWDRSGRRIQCVGVAAPCAPKR